MLHKLESIDAILTLGGENPERRERSRKAHEVYDYVTTKRNSHLPILLSGRCSGLVLVELRPTPEKGEAN